MLPQASPLEPQMSHWYWNVNGADPFQVPGLAVSVLPTSASPLIVGNDELSGGAVARDGDPIARATATSAAIDTTTIDQELRIIPLMTTSFGDSKICGVRRWDDNNDSRERHHPKGTSALDIHIVKTSRASVILSG